MSSGAAMRCWAMSQPTLTMPATMRWPMKPGLSRITVTGLPLAASTAWAVSSIRGSVAGERISVRRPSSPNRQSTATVRAGSSFSVSAAVVVASPSGATRRSASEGGSAPSARRAPASVTTRVSAATCSDCRRLIHTVNSERSTCGRSGVGRFRGLAARIVVEAAPHLAPEKPGGTALGRDVDRPVARFFVVLMVDRLHHGVGDVEPRQVEELERTEAKAGRLGHDAVDVGEPANAFRDDAQGLGAEGPAGVVDEEPRRDGGAHRLTPPSPGDAVVSLQHPMFGEDA